MSLDQLRHAFEQIWLRLQSALQKENFADMGAAELTETLAATTEGLESLISTSLKAAVHY
jgi:hypothetical protein